ncbi:WD40-repeat-containing domain protein [Staphylotrichum tortipilum]|uniref:WD40-repeat-containing domain protein n=1 Tax=Staphylotrichum tortipilum TaxID=2831512 RepID=A0AAN6MID2_9PEZI|nr:WD40-repeat-containing domain protein [Staphylotrichum longicolle]
MNQPQQYQPQRRTGTYDELHMSSGMAHQQPPQVARDYAAPPGASPHIKLDQAAPSLSGYQPAAAVPNVLQPGGLGARAPAIQPNAVPTLPSMQADYQSHQHQTPGKPNSLSLSHSYSRSSPSAPYEGAGSGYLPYTPTTPGGSAASSQFMSPTEPKYNPTNSQRNISNTPLGLADIRPRADSSLSDGLPGTPGYELVSTQPRTSNYMAPWALYAFDWCKWAPQGNGAGKLAIGSYLEDGHNFIQILDAHLSPTPSDVYVPGGPKWSMDFTRIAEATHSFPVTRLLWEPPSSQKQSTDLLATSGDHLRLWSLPSETQPPTPGSSITSRNGRDMPVTKLTPLALLSNSKTPDHTAPLTSLDWNTVNPSLIITSSIDTTCTIWDIPSLTAKTQLIAHDKEVYDVRFCAQSTDVFVSCGQDGSVRMFDLRSLEHSTIIYEPTGKEERDANGGRISPTLAQQTLSHPPPLLRLATSPHDHHLLATFAQDSNVIRILDVRQPGQALLELRGHAGALNCVEWSPTRRGTLASGADDCQVLIWDLINQAQSQAVPNGTAPGGVAGSPAAGGDNARSPVASWQCDYEVGNVGWVPHLATGEYGEWLGVSAGRGVWGVRV